MSNVMRSSFSFSKKLLEQTIIIYNHITFLYVNRINFTQPIIPKKQIIQRFYI